MMDKQPSIILNTIVFKDQLDRGVKQKALLQQAKEIGVSNVEIRREYITDSFAELLEIYTESKKLHIDLFYSINDDLILQGKVNQLLSQYISEALMLEAKILKLNVGNVPDLAVLKEIPQKMPADLTLMVENNQIKGNGSLNNIETVVQTLAQWEIPIQLVFDTANWAWVGDDPYVAAAKLSPYTGYLHLKNFELANGGLQTSGLFEGELNINQILSFFPTTTLMALEYPEDHVRLKKDIEKIFRILVKR